LGFVHGAHVPALGAITGAGVVGFFGVSLLPTKAPSADATPHGRRGGTGNLNAPAFMRNIFILH
jgi:hypothetical protein